MAENNLTTTGRAAIRSAYGVKINDPENAGSVITRKPDETGMIDLTDLSTSSEPTLNVGDFVGVPISSAYDYQIGKSSFMKYELNGIKTDLSNLPNGLTFTISKNFAPLALENQTVIRPSEVSSAELFRRQNTINSTITTLPALVNGVVSFTKDNLLSALDGNTPVYNYTYSPNGGSYGYVPDVPEYASATITSVGAQFHFSTKNEKLTLDYYFCAISNTRYKGVANMLLDSIKVY